MIFIVHTMPRRWVYLKMGLPDAYKENHFESRDEFTAYVMELLAAQGNCCALSGLGLQFDGEVSDRQLLASLDRIDSSGHYAPGNLQVVCQFINRWKSADDNAEFKRLVALVQGL